MTIESVEKGDIAALINAFESDRLPRAMQLHVKVKTGEILSGRDVQFLDQIMYDSQKIMSVTDNHPENKSIASKAINLYSEIVRLSLENEKRAIQNKY